MFVFKWKDKSYEGNMADMISLNKLKLRFVDIEIANIEKRAVLLKIWFI